MANKLMTAALRLELPDLALDVFEDSFGFYVDTDPAKGRGGSGFKFQIFFCYFFRTFFLHFLYFLVFCISCIIIL
jgi:hypothetical protein